MKLHAAKALGTALGIGAIVIGPRLLLLRVTVRGPSMEPTYRDGEVLLAWRRTRSFSRGRVAVIRSRVLSCVASGPNEEAYLIKRIAAVPGDRYSDEPLPHAASDDIVPAGCLVVLGDNPDSFDSRSFGYIPIDAIVGIVVRSQVISPKRSRSMESHVALFRRRPLGQSRQSGGTLGGMRLQRNDQTRAMGLAQQPHRSGTEGHPDRTRTVPC